MRFLAFCAVCLGAQASADGLSHFSLDAQFMSGETSRDADGLTGSFSGATRFSAAGVYDSGAFTLYGTLVLDQVEFFNRGDTTNARGTDIAELGVDYAVGQFVVGVNASALRAEDLPFETTLTSVALYGQYDWGDYYAGLGILTLDDTADTFSDVGAALFGGYETDTGLSLGAQVAEVADGTFYTAFATYDADTFEIAFDLTADDDDRLARFFGAYYVVPEFAVIGGIVDLDTGGDGTSERFLGGRVDLAPGFSAEVAFYDFDAFNNFEGNGIAFKLAYEVGTPRRGYQSFATFSDRLLSPVFYSF
ncbi:MAG: hypothetical protein AAF714_03340 [Pseudomonadota bacterium]